MAPETSQMALLVAPETSQLALLVAHWISAFVVLAEGLNKLHRTDPLEAGLSSRQRVVVLLKCLAWCLLVLGAAGALVRPLVQAGAGLVSQLLADRVSAVDLFILGGFAVLIVRSRLKEG